eukprot:g7797.t1
MSRLDQRKALVRSFLQANDFLHVNEGKRYWGHTCYPLHVAVHQKNAAVIKALLLLGARSDLKYRGYTPEEYAQRKHRRWGGYDDVLKVLDETARPKRTFGRIRHHETTCRKSKDTRNSNWQMFSQEDSDA